MAQNDDDNYEGNNEGNADDTALLRDLRKQIKAANKELSELRQYRTERVLQKAGFDPDSKQAKMLMRLHGDDDFTVEALQATAAEFDIPLPADTADEGPVDEVAAQRSEATARIDDLRANATPVGTTQLAYEEYQQLRDQNPAAAASALASGQVVLPAYIAAGLEANRADTA